MLCCLGYLLQIPAVLCLCACYFKSIYHSGHPPAAVGFCLGRAGHIILYQDHFCLNVILHIHCLTGKLKVHPVSAVIAKQHQDSASLIASPYHISHFCCGRGSKHIAYRTPIQKSLSHIPKKNRQMAGTSGSYNAYLSFHCTVIA